MVALTAPAWATAWAAHNTRTVDSGIAHRVQTLSVQPSTSLSPPSTGNYYPRLDATHPLQTLAPLLVSFCDPLSVAACISPVSVHDKADVVRHGPNSENEEEDAREEGVQVVQEGGDGPEKRSRDSPDRVPRRGA